MFSAGSSQASEDANTTLVKRFVNFWASGTRLRETTDKPWSEVDANPSSSGGIRLRPAQWATYHWAPPAHRDSVIRIDRMIEREGTAGCTITCPQPYGKFRHPNDCSKYYECGGQGEVFIKTCPYPLLFNEKEDKCDWPELVGCPNPPFSKLLPNLKNVF